VSADVTQPTLPKRPQKLAIVHFLGWTLGVAVVLGIYRAINVWTAWLNNEANEPVEMSWRELGYGLAYGTAVSGLGLYVWRWWRGSSAGPSQPGHWLLVIGGITLVIDLGVATSVFLAASLRADPNSFSWTSYGHQAIGYGLAAGVSLVIFLNLRDAGRLWIAATMIVMVMLTTNAIASGVSLVVATRGVFPGTWIWWIPLFFRVAGAACFVAAISAAEINDRLRGRPRDWLHLGGIVAVLGLGLVDVANYGPVLWRYW
jgi:hypothetical protein